MVAAVSAHDVVRPIHAAAATWCLGAAAADALLGAGGLAVDAVHEVKPVLAGCPGSAAATRARSRHAAVGGVTAGDRAAALVFALALARRRLEAASGELSAGAAAKSGGDGMILWCEPRHAARELGRLHAPGLAAFGLAADRLMLVETCNADEALWVLEEGLRSGALALAVGQFDDVALTPARRLALAAERFRTPCLLLTGARAPPVAATATRWRIGRTASALHPFDAQAPGASRLSVSLERCRGQPHAAERAFTLEWSDEAYRFHMAAGMADRADAPGGAVVAAGAGRSGGEGTAGAAEQRFAGRARLRLAG